MGRRHLTSLLKKGVGTFSSVSALNHEKAPMYAYSDLRNALEFAEMFRATGSESSPPPLEAQVLMGLVL